MNYRHQVPCESCGAKRPETRPILLVSDATAQRIAAIKPLAQLAAVVPLSSLGVGLIGHSDNVAYAIRRGTFEYGASLGGGVSLVLMAAVAFFSWWKKR